MRTNAVQINPNGTYGVSTQEESKLLPVEWANEPPSYYHYPQAWAWEARYSFIPNLCAPRHKAGCNGVDQVRDRAGAIIRGKVNTNGLHTGCRAKGGIEIDPADKRLGPWMGFIKKVPTEGGGNRYVFGIGSKKDGTYRGETFKRLANGKIHHKGAGDAYLEFCAYLRDHGLVHDVDEEAVEGLIEAKVSAIDQMLRLANGKDWVLARAEKLQAEVDAMRLEWDRIRAANPEPGEDEGEDIDVEDAAPGERIAIGEESAP